jgi:hypothetical protein
VTVHRLVPSEVEAESLSDLLEDVRAIPDAAFARLMPSESSDRGFVVEYRKADDAGRA